MDEANDPVTEDRLEEIRLRRREALRKIAAGAAYAAPTTLLVTSMEASACSLTC